MRKVLIGLLTLVGLCGVAVLLLPRLIDWNAYRGVIADRAQALTGRRVTIDGDIRLSILPGPVFSAQGVRLANPRGKAAPDMLSVKAIKLQAAFWPLLAGRLAVQNLILVSPEIALELLPGGQGNWFAGGGPGQAPPPPVPSAERVSLDRVTIQDGTFRFRRGDVVDRLDHVNVQFLAHSLTGPFTVQGDMEFNGAPLHIESALDHLGDPGGSPLTAALAFPNADARLRLDGALSFREGKPVFSGKIHGEGKNLAGMIASMGEKRALPRRFPGFMGQEFELDGAVTLSGRDAGINDVRARLGETRVAGAVVLTLSVPIRADLTLAVTRIDLDGWLGMPPVTPQARPQAAGPAPARAAVPGTPPAAKGIGGFTFPRGLVGSIEASVDAIVYRGDALRQARVNAALDEDRLVVNQASVQLPGGGDVSLFGTLMSSDGALRYDGTVQALADNLRAVLDWFKLDTSRIAADRLHKFSLSAKISGSGQGTQLSAIGAEIDSSRISGAATALWGPRTRIEASLALDHLDLDGYTGPAASDGPPAATLPLAPPPAPPPASMKGEGKIPPMAAPVDTKQATAAAAKTKPPPLLGDYGWLADFDGLFKLRAGSLTRHGVPLREVEADLGLEEGSLTFRRAVANAAGGTLQLGGGLSGFGEDPAFHKLTFEIRAPDGGALGRLFGLDSLAPGPGAVAFKGQADGSLSDLQWAWESDLPSGRSDLKGHLKLEGSQLLTLSGLDGHLYGMPLAGSGGVDWTGARPRIALDVKTGLLDLDTFFGAPATPKPASVPRAQRTRPASRPPAPDGRWSRDLFDVSALKAVDADLHLRADGITRGGLRLDRSDLTAKLADGVVEVSRLNASLFHGDLSLTGRFAADLAPSAKASFSLRGASLRELLAALAESHAIDGKVNLTGELGATGRSHFDMMANLGGTLAVQAQEGQVRGLNLDAAAARLRKGGADLIRLAQSAAGGATRFSNLEGKFTADHGILKTDDLHLAARSGTVKTTGSIDLVRWQADLVSSLVFKDLPRAPPLRVRTLGPLEAPRLVFDVNPLEAYMAEKPRSPRGRTSAARSKGSPAAPGQSRQ